MEIGHKLKQLRVRQNLTLEELASRCELTKGFLSQVERNLTSPSIVTLNDILEALGSSLADFFTRSTGSFRIPRRTRWSRSFWKFPQARQALMSRRITERNSAMFWRAPSCCRSETRERQSDAARRSALKAGNSTQSETRTDQRLKCFGSARRRFFNMTGGTHEQRIELSER